MLHVIFQRHHIPPHEVYALDPRHKAFMIASMMLELEPAAKAAQKEREEQAQMFRDINFEGS